MSDELYREIILDRYRNPQFRGKLAEADVEAAESNPLCGDSLSFQLKLDGCRVSGVGWRGEGCAISLASADLLAERMVGMRLDEVGKLTKEDILEMLGVDLGPARLKCAMLGLACVRKGIEGEGVRL